MSEPPKERPVIEYHKPENKKESVGCLLVAVIVLIPLGIIDVLSAYGMLTSGDKVAVIAGSILIIGTGIILYVAAKVKVSRGAVAAAALIVICLFLLLIGTCGSFAAFGSS